MATASIGGPAGGQGVSPLGGVLVLVIASILVCGILAAARAAMAALMPHLGPAVAGNAPLMETVFDVVVFVPILVAAVIGGGLAERTWPFGLGHRPMMWGAIGGAIGLAGISTSTGYAAIAGTLVPGASGPASAAMLIWGAAVVLLQSAAEEVYFRGWLQPALQRRWDLAPALVATALAFAALHVAGGARGAVTLLNLFLGGCLFGLLAAHVKGLAAPIATHFVWNATEQLGFGLDPNPGAGSFGSIIDWDLAGSAAWGGSREGLNASFGMTFALLAIVVPLVLIDWRALVGPVAVSPRSGEEFVERQDS